ncbi:hypothetical protein ACTA71_009291 [Dictyostelium dimigraforme]
MNGQFDSIYLCALMVKINNGEGLSKEESNYFIDFSQKYKNSQRKSLLSNFINYSMKSFEKEKNECQNNYNNNQLYLTNDNYNNNNNNNDTNNTNNNFNHPNNNCNKGYEGSYCCLESKFDEILKRISDIDNKLELLNSFIHFETTNSQPSNFKIKTNVNKKKVQINYFSKDEMHYDMLKSCKYFIENNIYLELMTKENKNKITIYVINSTASRINFDFYKKDIDDLIKLYNVILLFIVPGSQAKPIAKVDQFHGNFVTLQYFGNSILDTEQNNQQFKLLCSFLKQ